MKNREMSTRLYAFNATTKNIFYSLRDGPDSVNGDVLLKRFGETLGQHVTITKEVRLIFSNEL